MKTNSFGSRVNNTKLCCFLKCVVKCRIYSIQCVSTTIHFCKLQIFKQFSRKSSCYLISSNQNLNKIKARSIHKRRFKIHSLLILIVCHTGYSPIDKNMVTFASISSCINLFFDTITIKNAKMTMKQSSIFP